MDSTRSYRRQRLLAVWFCFILLLVGFSAAAPAKTRLGVQGLPGDPQEFALAEKASVNFGRFFGRWDEPVPGQYNWNTNVDEIPVLGAYLRELKRRGFTAYVMLANVHMEGLQMPEYLAGRPFDDPYVIERWELYLTKFLDRYGRWIDYISIGNELDAYFSKHEEQFPGFVEFVARGAEVIRREAPHIQVGSVLTSSGFESWWPQLAPHLDFLGATYYAPVNMFGGSKKRPLDESHPDYFSKALSRVLKAAGEKKVLLAELGCATAPEVNSSPEAQAEFIRRFFEWLPQYEDRILAVQFVSLRDWPYQGTKAALKPLLSAELLSNETFLRFLSSLGLRDEKGNPKPGWRAWVRAAQQYRGAAQGSANLAAASPSSDGEAAGGRDVQWNHIRGVNYFTSTASNAHEMWRSFDAAAAARELGWLRAIGFNSVRLWLSVPAHQENPARFLDGLKTCLDLCERRGLTAMLVLFDSCGIEPREDAVEMSVHEAYQKLLEAERFTEAERNLIRSRYQEFAARRGKHMRVKLAPETPYDILFWQNWQPNPGYSKIHGGDWKEFEAYTQDVAELARAHPAVISIDIMNEPGCLFDLPEGVSSRAASETVEQFVRHFAERARRAAPQVPVTVGSADIDWMKRLADVQPVLSVHSYELGDELKAELRRASAFAQQRGKPILLTECLANTDGWLKTHGEEARSSDKAQLEHYRETLPVILDSGMGWYSWGGIVGQMFTPFTDILYPNGYLRPAAVYLERQLKGQE